MGNMNLDREGDTTERTLPTLQASDLPFEGMLDGAGVGLSYSHGFWRLLILTNSPPHKKIMGTNIFNFVYLFLGEFPPLLILS
uniref:Uncharacterized protein n=1 Tax=Rhinopithecus roxellana TaxID=61622 RepID=A0A2K6P4Q1_RHIRO